MKKRKTGDRRVTGVRGDIGNKYRAGWSWKTGRQGNRGVRGDGSLVVMVVGGCT